MNTCMPKEWLFFSIQSNKVMLVRCLKCVTAVIWVPYQVTNYVLSLIMLLMVPSKRQCKTTRLLRCCKIAHLNFYQLIDYWTVNSFFFSMSWGSIITQRKISHSMAIPLKSLPLLPKVIFPLHCRRHRPSDVVDVGDQRSSQELFLNLEKEHTCIAPQVCIVEC